MGMHMLVTITIPGTEERMVVLGEESAKVSRVKMKTATRPRLQFAGGKRSVAGASKKKRPGRRSQVSVA
jgi:hypothetical protein